MTVLGRDLRPEHSGSFRLPAGPVLHRPSSARAPPRRRAPRRSPRSRRRRPRARAAPACAPDNGGLTLADGLLRLGRRGRRRAGAPARRRRPTATSTPRPAGGCRRRRRRAFRDRDGDGKPDERASFGPRGGNDVEVHDGYLYLALKDRVVRWQLTPGKLEPAGEPETDRGRPARRRRPQARRALAFPGGDVMLVNIGSATNSCQRDRIAREVAGQRSLHRARAARRASGGSPPSRAGQRFADGRRWATGIRNAEALGDPARDRRGLGRGPRARPAGRQLGLQRRGQREQSGRGAGAGRRRATTSAGPTATTATTYTEKVLAPEYGGDGQKVGRCAKAKDPAIAFPGHWAPMALAFYPGDAFGPQYTGRAVRRLPRDLEPRAAAAGGLPRGVRAVRRRQADGRRTRPSRPARSGRPSPAERGSRWGRTGRCSSRRGRRTGRSGGWSGSS